jgi:hypothetical protein
MLKDLSALAPCSLLADCAHVIGMIVVLKDDVEQFNVAHEALVLRVQLLYRFCSESRFTAMRASP